MVIRARRTRRARIEIIPMIDVVFFLLVFFMMASLAMSASRSLPVSLPVSLPEAASADDARTEAVAITLTADGRMLVGREPVSPGGLGAKIRPLIGRNRELAVVVHADREVTHARVVDALDGLRQAGVIRIAIAVAPKRGAVAPATP